MHDRNHKRGELVEELTQYRIKTYFGLLEKLEKDSTRFTGIKDMNTPVNTTLE